MKIYLIRKEKNRIYKSEDILRTLFDIGMTHNKEGAPVLEKGFVSVSDTSSFWICAFSDYPVGIDIEDSKRIVKPSVAKRLHSKEQEYLAPLNPEGREWKEEFLSIWVKKEAYMKLLGKGLKLGLSGFCTVSDEEMCRIADDYVRSFLFGNLYIGLAGKKEELECFAVEEISYDAPFVISCIDAAAALLDGRMYSCAELKKKLLEKGYDEAETEKVCESFSEYGYLNDEEYARRLAEKHSKAGKAPKLIALELSKKGITKDLAGEVSSEYSDGSKEKAFELAKKCLKGKELSSMDREEQVKQLAKVGRKLASFGYETSVIYDILDRLKL